MPDGPDPDRVRDLPDLAAELAMLRVRSARGTGRPTVSLAELTRRMGLPPTSKSTVHSYASGRTLAPAECLDAMVIALGADAAEQRAWAEAWFRVAAQRHRPRAAPRDDGARVAVPEAPVRSPWRRMALVPRPGTFTMSRRAHDVPGRVAGTAPYNQYEPVPAPCQPRRGHADTRPRFRGGALAAVAVVVGVGVLADRPAPVEAGAPAVEFAARPEFLAKLVNQATGKCLSRNGAFTHPGESERVGEAVYQWECAGSDNPGHRVVVAPVGGGWQIRSSSRADLCLAADGAPGVEQRFRRCAPDDRQRWVIVGEPAVVRNADTGLCLAHQGGDPLVHIQVFQRDCALGPEATWRVEPYPPLGPPACLARADVRLRNHETGATLGGVVDLRPEGSTAQGCAVSIERAARCLTARPDVDWLPCTHDADQRWIPGPVGEAEGRSWLRLHAAQDVSRCLQATTPPTTRLCDAEWDQQWHAG